MKKFVFVFCGLLVLAALFSPVAAHAAPVHAPTMQSEQPPASDLPLPDDLGTIIKLAIGLLVTQGLKSLSKLLGADLNGWGAAITASIATSVILFFNALLAAVPAAAAPSVAVSLTLIVTVLGAFGLKDTLNSFKSSAALSKK